MHDIPILNQIIVSLGLSAIAVWIFQRLKLPAILGFLLTGVIVGPTGLGLIPDRQNIEVMAEIGIILLLFTIGIEFSLKEMIKMRRMVFGGGALQMILTTGVLTLLFSFVGFFYRPAIFLGLLISLSSTAIVLKLLGDRGEWGSRHGRMILAVLLLQDLGVIVLMLLVPILAGKGGSWLQISWGLVKAALVIGGILFVASKAIPWLFDRVVHTRSRELFTMVTVLTIFGTAWLTGVAGLSLAIGAFVAGMVVSESMYSHQMLSEILPFRDVFNGLFFVSVGMLVDLKILWAYPVVVIGFLIVVILIKAAVAGGVARLMGESWPTALCVGLGLAQVGEFAFVLADQGKKQGIVTPDQHAIFLLVCVLTMILTPFLVSLSTVLAAHLKKKLKPSASSELQTLSDEAKHSLHDHAIIVGYGVNGRNVARALRLMEVPYAVIELNAQTVSQFRGEGEHILYGDAGRDLVLFHAGLEKAKVLVVAIADAPTSRQVVAIAREACPDLPIYVRTRFIAEVDELKKLGATRVIPEEFETSIELTGLIMQEYGASSQAILRKKEALRRSGYRPLRDDAPSEGLSETPGLFDLMGELELEYLTISEDFDVAGKSIAEIRLRSETGATILGILRKGALMSNPHATALLLPEDRLIFCGTSDQISKAYEILRTPKPPPPSEADAATPAAGFPAET